MYSKSFHIDKNKILLYGAAHIGQRIFPVFENNGYHISGYIDKRGDEIKSFMGRPCYSLDNSILDKFIENDYVIFVSVKNVFEHTNIANELVKRGFKNIIYRPIESINGIGNEAQNILYDAYSNIEIGDFENLEELPCTLEVRYYKPVNTGLIFESPEFVVANISVDMLHTDKKARTTPWFDKPVQAMLPHIGLFRFIDGDINFDTIRYLNYCEYSANESGEIKTSESWRRNVLKNRSSVFEHMSYSMEMEPDFFIRNAPNAIYNSSTGVFNLNSGKHRAAFFVAKRKKYIPLKIKRDDYETFINNDMIEKTHATLVKNGRVRIEAPIPHPFFFSFPCESKEFYYNFLYWLIYYLAEKLYKKTGLLNFESLSINCILHDLGFIERALLKAGCSVKIDLSDEEKCIMDSLDNLLRSDICNNRMNLDSLLSAKTKKSDLVIVDLDYLSSEKLEILIKQDFSIIIICNKEETIKLCNQMEARLVFVSIKDGIEKSALLLEK